MARCQCCHLTRQSQEFGQPFQRHRLVAMLGAFLPTTSPDFDPIEMAFSELKALLRQATERTVEGLWKEIGEILSVIMPKDYAGFFAAAGYEPV